MSGVKIHNQKSCFHFSGFHFIAHPVNWIYIKTCLQVTNSVAFQTLRCWELEIILFIDS